MNKKNHKILLKPVIILISFLIFYHTGISQNTNEADTSQTDEINYKIHVLAKVTENEVILRWAPDNAIAWHYANQHGYKIERYTLFRDNIQLKPAERKLLTTEPIKPVPEDLWDKAEKTKYNAAAWQAIYGESFEVKELDNEMLSIMNKTNEIINRYSFALFACDHSPEAAEYSGLIFRDKSFKKNEKYLYHVYTAIPPEIAQVDTGSYYLDAGKVTVYPKPLELTANFKDQVVELRWNQFYYQGIYTAWSVERSGDKGKSFTRINENPIVNLYNRGKQSKYMHYSDSLPENETEYLYRIIGHSAFGDDGPPSDTVSGIGKEVLKAHPILMKTLINNKGEALINWQFPEDYNPKLDGFKISSSSKAKGKYTEVHKGLISPDERNYLHKNPSSTNYYKVTAIDKHGKEYKSQAYLVQLTDSIPPDPPTGLKGQIDSTGMVHISWLPNPEEDLFGYRVYMSNHMNSEFSQITKKAIKDTNFQFKTTLKTLTEDMFLKVMAEDNRFNPSDYSEVIKVKRPDTIAPSPPVIKAYKIQDQCIKLIWANSMSKDVENHLVLRTPAGKQEWKTIAYINISEGSEMYCDSTAKAGIMYEYEVAAMDDAGNISNKSKSIKLEMSDRKILGEVKNLKAKVDREGKYVVLNWELPKKEIKLIHIYRKKGEGPLKTYKTFNEASNQFIDDKVQINTKYEYTVRVIYSDGKSSKFSERVTISY